MKKDITVIQGKINTFCSVSMTAIFVVIGLYAGFSVWSIIYKSELVNFLDKFQYSEHLIAFAKGFIHANVSYFIGGILLYLFFLSYVKIKKGLIFGDGDINGKYAALGIIFYQMFNIFIVIYLNYLGVKHFPYNYYYFQSGVLFPGIYIFSTILLINPDFRKKFFGTKFWSILYVLAVLYYFIMIFISGGYLEIFLVAFMGVTFNYILEMLPKAYNALLNDYHGIMTIHDIQGKIRTMLLNNGFPQAIKNFYSEETPDEKNWPIKFFWIFESHASFALLILALAFISIPVGINGLFNLLSIVYIHVTLIMTYIQFTLLANRFPGKVNLQIGKVWKKNVLLIENEKDHLIYMTRTGKYIVNKNQIFLIEVKSNFSRTITKK